VAVPRFPIRLLALDIDGTLVGDDLVIGPRTRAAVAAARTRGVAVSLVTGRMATSARGFAETLELRGPIVAYQGALVRLMPEPGSPKLGRLLYHRPLPVDVARDICAWVEKRGLEVHVNHLEQMVLRADEPHADDYSRFMGLRAVLVPSIRDYLRQPVTKLIAVGDEPGPLEAMEAGREAFAGRAEVTLSHPRFLEFLAPGISKGRAIRWLARRLDVPLDQTMAIGDQFNDLEMIAEVGHGVAMPSAPPGVLAAARYVAPPVEEEGAAQVIEQLVLGGRAAVDAERVVAG
jgi:Cof subfamily protein (haloacid dehalogenase superfamily)